jgi:ADP-ribosylglycohydrolase
MNKVVLNEKDYYSKVYGGWMGKNIGGTLGGPVEGKKELLKLDFYPVLADSPMPNDDLDLQLVWLHGLEQYGARLTAKELGQEWVEHVFFPYDEYGYALTNLRRGLVPPISGWFNNPFANCMGSPIRSEIWAMSAPGAPGVAAYYAYQDAIVDHAGGEGVYGEVFFAAIESAAFFESNAERLIGIGLKFIPEECRTAKAVRDLIKWYGEGRVWTETRELILKYHGRENFTDAPQNIAFTILGWLYGEDFGDAILKAVNCGYDTDCTGATLGAILGIIGGKVSIPEKWSKPVGDKIKVSDPVKGFNAPSDLEELAQRTLKVGREIMALWNIPIDLSSEKETFIPMGSFNEKGQIIGDYDPSWLWNYSFTTDNYLLPFGSVQKQGIEVLIDYGPEGPAIGRNQNKEITFKVINHSTEAQEGMLELCIPEGWKGPEKTNYEIASGESMEWKVDLQACKIDMPFYNLAFHIKRFHDYNLWNSTKLHFTLVTASHWIVTNQSMEEAEIICPGNRIDFEKAFRSLPNGTYKAKTKLVNPCHRKVKLIGGTSSGIKASLNGTLIFEDLNRTDFMPAYHRAPKTKQSIVDLPKGEHLLEIEVIKDDDTLDVFILPVATGETKKPGSYYYYIDMMML